MLELTLLQNTKTNPWDSLTPPPKHRRTRCRRGRHILVPRRSFYPHMPNLSPKDLEDRERGRVDHSEGQGSRRHLRPEQGYHPRRLPMPLQSDITSAVAGAHYITVWDGAFFFYQWNVTRSDYQKLVVVSHRGQEQVKVAVQGYRRNPP
ncbi:hypothetical protein BU16DRAFT_532567 [Lophium mytilinum]|uniref:Uncharacterized protein n=1 Tax=Lophium mytilinum TaxID=390894 RepID=A0A6A6RCA6_9PEZI|nr:hypothetical protein BU16DRAFT_532567 [Lophium mytilinum]